MSILLTSEIRKCQVFRKIETCLFRVSEGFLAKELVFAAVGWETPRGHPVLTTLFTPPVILNSEETLQILRNCPSLQRKFRICRFVCLSVTRSLTKEVTKVLKRQNTYNKALTYWQFWAKKLSPKVSKNCQIWAH